MPAAQPAGVENENMKTAETSHIHLPFSFGFGAYPARYAPFGFRSGLGITLFQIVINFLKNLRRIYIINMHILFYF